MHEYLHIPIYSLVHSGNRHICNYSVKKSSTTKIEIKLQWIERNRNRINYAIIPRVASKSQLKGYLFSPILSERPFRIRKEMEQDKVGANGDAEVKQFELLK